MKGDNIYPSHLIKNLMDDAQAEANKRKTTVYLFYGGAVAGMMTTTDPNEASKRGLVMYFNPDRHNA